jgi:hypothetical protein
MKKKNPTERYECVDASGIIFLSDLNGARVYSFGCGLGVPFG